MPVATASHRWLRHCVRDACAKPGSHVIETRKSRRLIQSRESGGHAAGNRGEYRKPEEAVDRAADLVSDALIGSGIRGDLHILMG